MGLAATAGAAVIVLASVGAQGLPAMSTDSDLGEDRPTVASATARTLTWVGESGCPNVAQVHGTLEALAGEAALWTREVSAHATVRDRKLVLRIVHRGAEQVSTHRHDDCGVLAELTALKVAIVLDAVRSAAQVKQWHQRAESNTPNRAPAPGRSRSGAFAADANGGIAVGPWPAPTATASLGWVAQARGRFYVRAGYGRGASTPLAGVAQLHADELELAAFGCAVPAARQVRFPICGGAAGGGLRVRARGDGVRERPGWRPFVDMRGFVAAEFPLVGWLYGIVRAELSVSLWRPVFGVGGVDAVVTAPAVGGGLSVGLGFGRLGAPRGREGLK